jgi:Golgi phosphoprotein 3 (GPP34)
MLIAEDFLLLAVDDETGKTANVDNLGVRLAGALLADLAAANKTLMRGAPEAGATKEEREKAGDATILVTDNAPTGHVALDAALQAALDAPDAPARKIVEAISENAEENLLAALVERGILEKEESKLFRMLPVTRWPAADSSHETALRATLTKVLVDVAEPDERTATLISLLHGSGLIGGLVGKEQRKAAQDRAEEIAGSEWGVATVATQVAIAATVATVATVGVAAAAFILLSNDGDKAAEPSAAAAAEPAEAPVA